MQVESTASSSQVQPSVGRCIGPVFTAFAHTPDRPVVVEDIRMAEPAKPFNITPVLWDHAIDVLVPSFQSLSLHDNVPALHSNPHIPPSQPFAGQSQRPTDTMNAQMHSLTYLQANTLKGKSPCGTTLETPNIGQSQQAAGTSKVYSSHASVRTETHPTTSLYTPRLRRQRSRRTLKWNLHKRIEVATSLNKPLPLLACQGRLPWISR